MLVKKSLFPSNPVDWDTLRVIQMKLEDIYQFFRDPPPNYLNKEVAVCYIIFILLQRESYGTELIEQLEQDYPSYRLSDTVLYSALKFLEDEGIIVGYWKKVEGRGRPRRMYQISPEWQPQAQELAEFWCQYITRGN
jgi:DNA-binding HxlR family transcriptional regulator